MTLPTLPKDRKEKRGIITSLIIHFIGLTYEGVSSFLHNRRYKTLYKVVVAMENKVNLQCNKLIHLEDSMVMCYAIIGLTLIGLKQQLVTSQSQARGS